MPRYSPLIAILHKKKPGLLGETPDSKARTGKIQDKWNYPVMPESQSSMSGVKMSRARRGQFSTGQIRDNETLKDYNDKRLKSIE